MSYHYWYWRGTVAYFIPEVVQNLLAKISFGATLSAIIIIPLRYREKTIRTMYTLNFPSGQSQTYPDYTSLCNAAKAMGGDVKVANSAAKIYVFVPKK